MTVTPPHPVQFSRAFYVKLGAGGEWESDSLANGVIRFGWAQQSIDDIHAGRWDRISQQLRAQLKPGVATSDLNRLRDIAESTEDDLWITFAGAKLWWARLTGPVRQDATSKYRATLGGWRDTSTAGKLLILNELPGKLAMLQGFRGTVCRVHEHDLLARVLSGERSELAESISSHRRALAGVMEQAIRALHWKDFETLVDLVFRDTGWERVSVLGQQARGYDLELREAVTGDRYVVQVKSQARRADLAATAAQFSPANYRRVFFVVHSPAADLAGATDLPEYIQLLAPTQLAELALASGLVQWLEDKAS